MKGLSLFVFIARGISERQVAVARTGRAEPGEWNKKNVVKVRAPAVEFAPRLLA